MRLYKYTNLAIKLPPIDSTILVGKSIAFGRKIETKLMNPNGLFKIQVHGLKPKKRDTNLEPIRAKSEMDLLEPLSVPSVMLLKCQSAKIPSISKKVERCDVDDDSSGFEFKSEQIGANAAVLQFEQPNTIEIIDEKLQSIQINSDTKAEHLDYEINAFFERTAKADLVGSNELKDNKTQDPDISINPENYSMKDSDMESQYDSDSGSEIKDTPLLVNSGVGYCPLDDGNAVPDYSMDKITQIAASVLGTKNLKNALVPDVSDKNEEVYYHIQALRSFISSSSHPDLPQAKMNYNYTSSELKQDAFEDVTVLARPKSSATYSQHAGQDFTLLSHTEPGDDNESVFVSAEIVDSKREDARSSSGIHGAHTNAPVKKIYSDVDVELQIKAPTENNDIPFEDVVSNTDPLDCTDRVEFDALDSTDQEKIFNSERHKVQEKDLQPSNLELRDTDFNLQTIHEIPTSIDDDKDTISEFNEQILPQSNSQLFNIPPAAEVHDFINFKMEGWDTTARDTFGVSYIPQCEYKSDSEADSDEEKGGMIPVENLETWQDRKPQVKDKETCKKNGSMVKYPERIGSRIPISMVRTSPKETSGMVFYDENGKRMAIDVDFGEDSGEE